MPGKGSSCPVDAILALGRCSGPSEAVRRRLAGNGEIGGRVLWVVPIGPGGWVEIREYFRQTGALLLQSGANRVRFEYVAGVKSGAGANRDQLGGGRDG